MSGIPTIGQLLSAVQPVAVYASESAHAGHLEDARRAAAACHAYLALYARPNLVMYNPEEHLKKHAPRLADDAHSVDIEPLSESPGDPDRMLDCLRALVRGAVLDGDSALVVEAFEENKLPCITLSFDGPGRFPRDIALDGFFPLTLDEWKERWTLATRGGRIDKAPNGLSLRLQGVRKPPEPVPALEPLIDAFREAAAQLEAGNPPLDILDRCMAFVDPPSPKREPVGLKAFFAEVIDEWKDALSERGIEAEVMADPGTPSLIVDRNRIRGFVTNLIRYAQAVLPRGGQVTVLTEYDAGKRTVETVIGIQDPQCVTEPTFHLAALRRAIETVHGGTFACTPERGGVTVTAALPDTVGRALDEWIPGFDVFAEQARQMLRLLKSGSPAPPEEILLAGILESELERWLIPKLAGPAAQNIAHDLPEENKGLPGSSTPRFKKALQQIQRGKPRKEIAAPSYAAEILWAYRSSERHRAAIGAERFDQPSIERFCRALLADPPDYVAGLRLLAEVIGKGGN